MARLRTVALVAAFDFAESLRSRKAIALLLLYCTGGLAATSLFIRALNAIEEALADTLSVARTARPGAMTATLFESDQFRRLVTGLVGDRELATEIVKMPPLALFYGALALALVPLLVVLTSSDAIAQEVATGSSRFALFRSDRLSWALGKLAGQAALMTVGIIAGALGSYLLGAIYLASFKPADTAFWMLRMSARAWLYGFAFLGLALGTSQLTRSVNWSRALGVFAWFLVATAGAFLSWDRVVDWAPTIVPTMTQLLPSGHRLDLWRPSFWDRLPAAVMLITLGVVYFSAGHYRFSRRDA